jgi:hypothetical protein
MPREVRVGFPRQSQFPSRAFASTSQQMAGRNAEGWVSTAMKASVASHPVSIRLLAREHRPTPIPILKALIAPSVGQ